MAFPPNSLRAFLRYAKDRLSEALEGKRKVNLVIGNESADLDSLTSSLLYAYVRSISPPPGAFSPVYIPLLNIPASSIRLRPEFATVCAYGGINPSYLISLDEIASGFSKPADTTWILVDHNKLQGALGSQFSKNIRGVIDHHEEENAVPRNTDPEPRIIERAGSCTSLVVKYCKPAWDSVASASLSSGAGHAQGEFAINDAAVTQGWNAQIAKLALASVLIDTANFSAPGKVELVDRDAVEALESVILLSPKDARSWSREDFFKVINQSKQDIGSLSLEEILIKDYKDWAEGGKKVGVSSTVKPLAFLVQKGNKEDAERSFDGILDDFIKARNLTTFSIMTAFHSDDGNFQRELFLQDVGQGHLAAKNFCSSAAAELGLADLNLDVVKQTDFSTGKYWRNYWLQGDSTKSRKQVAPLLREALKSA